MPRYEVTEWLERFKQMSEIHNAVITADATAEIHHARFNLSFNPRYTMLGLISN